MSNDTINKLAKHICRHRKHAGLSQAALATYAGVGKTVIYDLEHEKSTVQFLTLLKVLKVLNIEIEFNSPLINHEQNDATS